MPTVGARLNRRPVLPLPQSDLPSASVGGCTTESEHSAVSSGGGWMSGRRHRRIYRQSARWRRHDECSHAASRQFRHLPHLTTCSLAVPRTTPTWSSTARRWRTAPSPPLAPRRKANAGRSARPSPTRHPRPTPRRTIASWPHRLHLSPEHPYRRDGTAQSATQNDDRPTASAPRHYCVLSCVRCSLAKSPRMAVYVPGAEEITEHKTVLSTCRRPLQRKTSSQDPSHSARPAVKRKPPNSTPLNFKVSEEFPCEFTTCAPQHNMNLNHILVDAFAALKEQDVT